MRSTTVPSRNLRYEEFLEGMQIFENFETIIVYQGQTKSHYCDVLGIAVTCSLSILKVGSQIRCLEYENVHVQSEIASS